MHIGRDIALLASLAKSPEQTFIVNQEGTDTQSTTATNLLNAAGNLFLATKAVAHTLTFLSLHGSRGIGCCTRAACQHQLDIPLLCILYHLFDFIVCQEHDAFGLGHTVDLNTELIESFQQGLHRAGALNARHLKAVLATVGKTFLRSGQVIQVTARHTDTLEEFPGIFHCVVLHIKYLFTFISIQATGHDA